MPFLSTPSGWRATSPHQGQRQCDGHFYPRPPGGGRHSSAGIKIAVDTISIHALRVEGDLGNCCGDENVQYFYPRPPGGGRRELITELSARARFLSTPSGWRATFTTCRPPTDPPLFLSTPSGWRATRQCPNKKRAVRFLSTPSGWRATVAPNSVATSCLFLSTPSGWRATANDTNCIRDGVHFYPRPPGGGRHDEK